ncbi:hypothetical protein BJ138DRAFT_1002848 [Hygrophoropsis aurantiaca]|uniref:Uncharacterized protein n=1 Tax=Hygrophoropsis aurantiaca TaxID=72124 RepID=A0ACB8AI82_9AGAM|nr:hypothetical protein BJ138DRAFT_1002848 [Hygrophoropsis aurantiaca]
MPFYQMLCIASHFREYKHIKDLVSTAATHVMDTGGVVRNIKFLGTQTLPQKMQRHRQTYTHGDYWTMHFDTSPRTLRTLGGIMRRDPRVIRWTMLKLGEKVEDVVLPPEKTVHRPDYLRKVGSSKDADRDYRESWSDVI